MLRSTLFALALLATPAAAQDLVPLPAQEPDVAWPTQGWPEGEAVDLAAVLDPVFATEVMEELGETRALVVIKGGQLVHERYRDGTTPDTRHVSWSMAKSFTHALVGRAVQLGLIADIDAPMPGAFPDGDPRSEITWRQWLTMTDGLDYREYGVEGLDNDVVQMMYGPGRFDVVAYARDTFAPKHAPGEVWNYSTAGYHLVARALQSLIPGICEDESADPRTCKVDPSVTSDWLDRVMFAPIGLGAVEEYDAAGTLLGGSLVYMSARDYAKFGLLYLRDGVWDGERLLPEGWVDFARTNPEATSDNGYGAGFWLSPEASTNPDAVFGPPYDAFHAGGHEGQTIWIVPSRDTVIVRVGLMPNTPDTWNGLFALNQSIVAAVD